MAFVPLQRFGVMDTMCVDEHRREVNESIMPAPVLVGKSVAPAGEAVGGWVGGWVVWVLGLGVARAVLCCAAASPFPYLVFQAHPYVSFLSPIIFSGAPF